MADPCDPVQTQGDSIVARFEFEPSTDDVVVAVVEAVEEFAAVESADTGELLNDVIDPDALRRCIESGGPNTRVTFDFRGYSVTATGEGSVHLSH